MSFSSTSTAHRCDVAALALLDRPHPVVARLRDDAARMAMPGQVRQRALVLLQRLAGAAVERGWDVHDLPVNLQGCHTDFQHVARYRAGTIEIELGDRRYEVSVDQKSPKASDPIKAGQLKIALPQSRTGEQSNWTDAKTASLEQRLPEVIEALASRAAADHAHQEAVALARAEQQAAQEAEAARTRARAKEASLAKELDSQAQAWERWRLLTAYCDQLEAQLETADPQAAQTESAREWLAWVRVYIAAIDPFKKLPLMPEPADDPAPYGSTEIPPDTLANVFAGRRPTHPTGSKIWEQGRRFHSNG